MTTRSMQRKGWSHKKKAGTEVWFGRTADQLPKHDVAELSDEVFASYSGPDKGLAIVPELEPVATPLENGDGSDANSNSATDKTEVSSPVTSPTKGTEDSTTDSKSYSTKEHVAGAEKWNCKSRKAYGISMSLYEQHPINGKISGDPIADSFGICSRTNNSIMIVADGVNWGEKSKLAARCAIYGSMNYINKRLFGDNKSISDTHESFQVLLEAVNCAHQTIIQYGGGQTTLCMALILPLKNSRQFAVCIVNVGDSLAYVFSKYHGIREITTGSHDIQSERDIRDAGGAVGPVHGNDPELHNLTCSMTLVDPGDVVYLTTDGISDNFDPVVTKIAVASRRRYSDPELQPLPEEGSSDANLNVEPSNQNVRCGTLDGKPEMEPHERHQYAVKEMERIIHEFELFTEQPCSAQELCGALLQHVLKLTDPKRKVLENPDLYGKKLRSKDRKRRDSEIIAKLSKSPGKLDHATIIGYEVGIYHGDDDEDYEIDEELTDEEMEEAENRVSDFNFDESLPSVVLKHDSNKVHDGSYACNSNHGNGDHSPVLSPESQKKKNSLKNLRLRVKSHFRGPGHKSRPQSISGPEPDVKSPNKYSSLSAQLSSSAPEAQRVLELKDALKREHDKHRTLPSHVSPTERQNKCSPIREVEGTSPVQSPNGCSELQSSVTSPSGLASPCSGIQSPTSPPTVSPTGRVQGRRAMRRAQAQRPHSSPPSAPELTSSSKPEGPKSSQSAFSDRSENSQPVVISGGQGSPNEVSEKETWIIRPKLSEAPLSVYPVRPRRQKRSSRAPVPKSNAEQKPQPTIPESSKVDLLPARNEQKNISDVKYSYKQPTSEKSPIKVSSIENASCLQSPVLSPSHSNLSHNPFFSMQVSPPVYNNCSPPAACIQRSPLSPTSDLSSSQSPNSVPLSPSVPAFKYNKHCSAKESRSRYFVMTNKTCPFIYETAI